MSSPAHIWSYRTLIASLVRRDLRAKYKRSLLGSLWSLLNPASTLLIYTLVFGVFLGGEAPLAGNGRLRNFAVFLFSALVAWNAFSSVYTSTLAAFAGAGPLLNKVYFPPECPALAATGGQLIQTGLEASILLIVLAALGNISLHAFLVPLILLQPVALGLGLGLVASLLNVQFRDIAYLSGIALQLLFYSTPIVYRLDQVPERAGSWLPLRLIISANPITHVADQMREVTYFLRAPSATSVLYSAGTSAFVLLLGWWIFGRRAPEVIEEL